MFGYKETGVAHGRGFAGSDANGLLAKILTFMTTAKPTCPGWVLYDDQSALATDPYVVLCDIAAPVVNDYDTGLAGGPPKFLKIGLVTAEAGYIRIQGYGWWNSTTHAGTFIWCGYRVTTYDDADFQYYLTAGDDGLAVTTRTGTTYDTTIITEFTGDNNFVEDQSVIGVLQSQIVAGSDVVTQLAAGQASLFTVGNRYFIYDFAVEARVNYVLVTARDTVNDTITLSSVGTTFTAGSVIAPYTHRWIGQGNNYTANNMSYYTTQIPYYSVAASGSCIGSQSWAIYGSGGMTYLSTLLNKLNPDDYNRRLVMKPFIYEYYDPTGATSITHANRAYGTPNNIYMCDDAGMVRLVDGRIIDGVNWLYHNILDNNGMLFPDV